MSSNISLQDGLLPADLSDEQFVVAMEQLRIPVAHFHHRDHIRLAWAFLRCGSLSWAEEKLAVCIRHFATHHNVPQKYHHTLTIAWTRLVDAAMRLTPGLLSFVEFAAAHPFLFNARLPWTFYSKRLLDSPAARENWIEPNLHPLPGGISE